ncbi:energy-coupling factor ABC transporter ATP-binding protein [Psychrobacillus lasiicapitis]|uniref:ATP-binding cassette domain-containing protein n=1 Tax=Psychrobacillus lasiicapitis TaxID=1636719 RepID=A0A544T4X6_9BACI|nr:ATP-binding cassette domain-containing protein [Psychrobacillus lasiicapitis]TQR12500.1 ATP-binding cassette domain-containing protein [Psychrobacillus lasiicapitis]GGA38628.1 ABC transporter ATP-binding protein [Psychrobacillus lasiicapitis]
MTAMIDLKNVSYRYPVSDDSVLKNISFSIEKGKFTAIIGNNGSGKTTLCNTIRGFVPHFYKGDLDGEVIIDQTKITDYQLGQLGEKVGYVFQNPFIQVSGVKDNVFEEVAYGLENLGIPVEEIKIRVEEVLKLVKIEYLRDKNPFELSGGQRQRVALASIIVMDPEILVIDEPTSQLDPIGTQQIFEIIRLMKERGKTIVLVEHKMDLIAEYADDLLVMHKGELVMQGPVREVFADPEFEKYQIQYPHVTEIALQLQQSGIPLSFLPIRDEELADALNRTEVAAHD